MTPEELKRNRDAHRRARLRELDALVLSRQAALTDALEQRMLWVARMTLETAEQLTSTPEEASALAAIIEYRDEILTSLSLEINRLIEENAERAPCPLLIGLTVQLYEDKDTCVWVGPLAEALQIIADNKGNDQYADWSQAIYATITSND